MNSILKFDTDIFYLINNRLTSPALDVFFPYITQKFNFLGIIIIAAALIWFMGNRRDRFGLILLVLAVGLNDFASDILKHLFMRLRPCSALEGARVLVGCGGSFSMPSSHASNIFTAMVFLSTRYKKFTPVFLVIAVLVAYSRVYVGVHYPSDIMVGAIFGTGIAFLFYFADKKYTPVLFDYFSKKRGSV
ncbi:MAG: phosphatase PAP2 family protein [Deltaproteobacteria bacterium]|nr:phosphatase PAP2 family protein [Deltaproteobacteria bacterium]